MAKWKEIPTTPSPEAIVRAALERAALMGGTAQDWEVDIEAAIRALADDPAVVAAIIKAAGQDRG